MTVSDSMTEGAVRAPAELLGARLLAGDRVVATGSFRWDDDDASSAQGTFDVEWTSPEHRDGLPTGADLVIEVGQRSRTAASYRRHRAVVIAADGSACRVVTREA